MVTKGYQNQQKKQNSTNVGPEKEGAKRPREILHKGLQKPTKKQNSTNVGPDKEGAQDALHTDVVLAAVPRCSRWSHGHTLFRRGRFRFHTQSGSLLLSF